MPRTTAPDGLANNRCGEAGSTRADRSGWATVAAALGPEADPGAKQYFRGTHRMAAPDATLARLRNLTPAMGITRVGNITGLDRIGIPTAIACRPNSRALAVAQGKGQNLDEAKAGALMESIESFHAERILLPLKIGSYEDLRPSHLLADPEKLPLAKNTLYHSRLPICWIEGYDLIGQEPIWMPYEMASLNFTPPYPSGFGCFLATSNGLAAGNHLLEAISHAICEVVERDAVALWECRGERWRWRRRLDLGTIDDPGCRELLERYARAGVNVSVWDITSDVGLAVFQCLITEQSADPGHVFYRVRGSGCHPSRAIALSRALTEAAQGRLTLIAGSRDNVYREEYEHLHKTARVEERRQKPAVGSAPRDFHDTPNSLAATIREDVLGELSRLRESGITQVIAIDLSQGESGIPVARVVIPGLEGVSEAHNYAPGARARAVRAGRA